MTTRMATTWRRQMIWLQILNPNLLHSSAVNSRSFWRAVAKRSLCSSVLELTLAKPASNFSHFKPDAAEELKQALDS